MRTELQKQIKLPKVRYLSMESRQNFNPDSPFYSLLTFDLYEKQIKKFNSEYLINPERIYGPDKVTGTIPHHFNGKFQNII